MPAAHTYRRTYVRTYAPTHQHYSQCAVYDSCEGKPQNPAGWGLVGCGREDDVSAWLSDTQVAQAHHLQ